MLNYKISTKKDNESIELAFKKTEADSRKDWIRKYTEEFEGLDYLTKKDISMTDLINKELVLFSISDNVRSIPSIVDGLKPGQRKVLFACFKKNLIGKSEIKVAQLAGYVSEQTAYHHGEHSLQETIINMAQNYTGSNNMNLLEPIGQFGTRLMSGKDSSSPRYIFTKLSKNSDVLFNKDDLPLLHYLDDDGQSIEPKFFVPTLPLVLINGTEGIGTGFSTKIPCFNPDDLKYCLEKLVEDEKYEIPELTPWYSGFKGTIQKINDNKWITYGKYIIEENIIKVTEIPIGESIENYKQYLEKLESEDTIVTFKNNSTDTIVDFEIKVKKEKMAQWEYAGTLEKTLKMTSNLNATNMHIFNEEGQIQKMYSAEEILFTFYKIRNKYHALRKQNLENTLFKELCIIESKVKYITAVVNEDLVLFKRKKNEIVEDINKMELYKIENSYDYLLSMPGLSFTEEKIETLNKEYKKKKDEYTAIRKTTVKDLWTSDLEKIN